VVAGQAPGAPAPTDTAPAADSAAAASAAAVPSPPPPDILTPLVGTVLATPAPVTGADGREHVAYEVQLTNSRSLLVTIQRIETLDQRGRVVATLDGPDVQSLVTVIGKGPGATLDAGQGAFAILEVVAATPGAVPRSLTHRITVSLEMSPGVPFDDPNGAVALTFETAPTVVLDRKPVVIAPPLRGPSWWDGNGCCASRSPHRGAVLAVNGAFYAPERYAIDFVQLDQQGRLFNGPKDQLSSYAFFGQPIYAVADGVVVNRMDGLPEQVPGKNPTDITAAMAGGNFIVQDIGGGAFAFYAHLQPGSLRFELGQKIRQGQVIGLLGNSGNSDAPHLHFHVMDGPSPLASNGVPYEFNRFDGQGVVGNANEVFDGAPAALDTSTLTGPSQEPSGPPSGPTASCSASLSREKVSRCSM
jgi:Peptidase family M23